MSFLTQKLTAIAKKEVAVSHHLVLSKRRVDELLTKVRGRAGRQHLRQRKIVRT